MSGLRAPGMLKVIGDAIKLRMCKTDMAFTLEDEEEDGLSKFQNIKDKNRRILSLMSEMNGALIQTYDKVIKK